MKPKEFIDEIDEAKIVAAIAKAEEMTSGEIRVYVSERRRANALVAAQNRFEKLGMRKTRLRNGVLIYIAPVTQQFAIVGDSGIHEKCGQIFWEDVSAGMSDLFKKSRFTEAIIQAVTQAGIALAKHFPREPGDTDELPNEILRD